MLGLISSSYVVGGGGWLGGNNLLSRDFWPYWIFMNVYVVITVAI
jgi:hypothetical protein